MAGKDAEVKVGADASAVERAAAAGKAALIDFASSAKTAVGSAARSIVTSFADIALAQGKVNFAAQHTQVRDLEAATARYAVASGRGFEDVRSSVERVGEAIGKRPREVASWINQVDQLTGSWGSAEKALGGIAGLAAETGRGIEDFAGFAAELNTVGQVAGDSSHAIGVLKAQADQLGTAGGIGAFVDQIQGLGGIISQFSIRSEQDFLRVTAAAAALGKGFSKEAAGRVQQGALGAIAADPLRFGRFLGRDITDEFGHVEDPTRVLQEITEKVKKRYGKDARRVLQLNFGAETGAALFRADFQGAAEAAGLAPSAAPKKALETYLQSDAGQRDKAAVELDKAARDLLGSSTALGRAADAMQRFAASNPITSTVVSTALGTGLSSFLTKYGSSLFGGAGGGVGSKGGGAAGGLLGKGGAVVAAGLAGVAVGEYLEDQFHLSDLISGTGKSGRLRADADASFASGEDARRATSSNIRAIQAAARAGGTPAPDVVAGSIAAQAIVQRQGAAGASALAGGGQGALAALVAELRREGRSGEDAVRIAKAIQDSLKTVKWTIVNSTGGPVEAVTEGGYSSAAGSQAGG